MEFSSNNKEILFELLSEYEAMSQSGDVALLDERDFAQLIGYFEKERQPEKALEAIDIALEIFSYSVDFYTQKASILLSMDRLDEARKTIRFAGLPT